MATYTITANLRASGLGSGGDGTEGKTCYLCLENAEGPDRLYDKLANIDYHVRVTVTIAVPDVVTGEKAEEALEGVAAMAAALEGGSQ